jgi:hypothetical protein
MFGRSSHGDKVSLLQIAFLPVGSACCQGFCIDSDLTVATSEFKLPGEKPVLIISNEEDSLCSLAKSKNVSAF